VSSRDENRKEERRRRRWLAVALPLSVLMGSALVWQSSESAFKATAATGTNSWASGNVTVTTDQTGAAVFNTLTNLQPDNNLATLTIPANGPFVATSTTNGGSRCIKVTYNGTSPANIRMYAAVTNTGTDGGLAQYLLFSVDTGSGATDVNCTNYTTSGTYLYGSAANNATKMSGFGSSWNTSAATEWSNVPATTPSKYYRISWLLPNGVSDNSQDETSTAVFTWEAQGI
jgi:hypothetical protein